MKQLEEYSKKLGVPNSEADKKNGKRLKKLNTFSVTINSDIHK